MSEQIKYDGMVYCSGTIGINPETNALVEGSITERTVRPFSLLPGHAYSGHHRSKR